MATKKTKPDWRYLVSDITQHCTEHTVALCGRVFEVGVFDANLHVHCADPNPSYEIHHLRHEGTAEHEDEETRERMWSALLDLDGYTESVTYRYTSSVNLDKCQRIFDDDREVEIDTEDRDAYNEERDAVLEHCNGNWNTQIPPQ